MFLNDRIRASSRIVNAGCPKENNLNAEKPVEMKQENIPAILLWAGKARACKRLFRRSQSRWLLLEIFRSSNCWLCSCAPRAYAG